MKLLFLLFLTSIVAIAAPNPTPRDPIIGKWRWRNQKVLIVSADATLLTDDGIQGRWEFLNNKEVARKYRFTWKGRSFENNLVLTKDF